VRTVKLRQADTQKEKDLCDNCGAPLDAYDKGVIKNHLLIDTSLISTYNELQPWPPKTVMNRWSHNERHGDRPVWTRTKSQRDAGRRDQRRRRRNRVTRMRVNIK
jgi:hypothetical protein